VVQIISFIPSVRGLAFPQFDGVAGDLTTGNARSLCTLWGRPLSTSRVADCH
jgi:hypothetical protein